VLERLRQRAGFEANTLVTGVDLYPSEPRFEVVYQFLSFAHNDRVRVRVLVTEEDAHVPTCTDLWPGASFSERECWDMFGIRFDGHPDLRRLLMPEAYGHHPLRKDFPHQGIEPDRLYREWDRERRRNWTPAP
jgi:NADH-quinone oxidoreductase subunit C